MKLVQITRVFKQCSFKYIVELGTFIIERLTIGRLTIGLWSICWCSGPSGPVRGAGGREGGQEEDKEVALVDPHLHRKQEGILEHSRNTFLLSIMFTL